MKNMNQDERRAYAITKHTAQALVELESLRHRLNRIHSVQMLTVDTETTNALNHIERLLNTFN